MKLTPFLGLLLATALLADDHLAEVYRTPPVALAQLIDAPLTPTMECSPDGKTVLVGHPAGLLTIADLAQPELKLAGVRFNPENRAPGRARYLKDLSLLDVGSHQERSVRGLPSEPHIHVTRWAPDSTHVAFTHATGRELQLWVIDVPSATAKQLEGIRLNYVTGTPYTWMPDAHGLLCTTVPDPPGTPPPDNSIPTGPAIQETSAGKKAPVRTFQDLLKNAHDEDLFGYYIQTDLQLVPLSGQRRKLQSGAVIGFDPSPDGRFVLVETVHRPYSHIVTAGLFPQKSEVIGLDGKAVFEVADLPVAEGLPPDRDAVRPGRRDIGWQNDADATLCWAEAGDGGDPKKDVPIHDRIYVLPAPFTASPSLLAALPLRCQDIDWGSNDLALITESWWKTRKTRTYRVSPRKADGHTTVIFDRSSEDIYSDPGEPAHKTLPNGRRTILTKDPKTIYLVGRGASPEGDRPFLDCFDLQSRKASRLWRSSAPYYERPVRILDPEAKAVLLLRESTTEPRNLFLKRDGVDRPEAISKIPHPAPQLKEVKKELIRYKRADGVGLTGMLYLPPGYTPKKDPPLPVLMWAYPAEFKSANAAGQVNDSPYRFVGPSPSGPIMFTLRGYAVLDDPSFPIVGEGKTEPNDTYVKQLVMGAEAAAGELVRRGIGDAKRMAIGGHSYGAFTTANLLAHSNIFRAGIARSGAYNRTLTPFGFQAEERTFWEARDTYVAMSPFTVADHINKPLLMIHGIEDSNPGTFPIQSERLFHAIKGLGGTARLVMLPKESHGYQARESVHHMAWEMDDWLERFVKPPPKK
jgi:dipeptidyl aminopeptidase/acylaminoacyl peptidase